MRETQENKQMENKIQKIKELLGITKLNELKQLEAGATIRNMIKYSGEKKLKHYCAAESILFQIMGVDMLVEKKMLTEAEIQDLHNKIKYMIELSTENLNESKELYNQYFKSKQATRDIKKISKDNYKWNSISETTVPEKAKMVVKYYDSKHMTYEGKPVTAALVQDMYEKGIILMPSFNKEAEEHLNR